MVPESATEVSPSSSTGTFSDGCGAIACFSVKHHGIDSADSPLCASVIRVRQQNRLNGRVSSVPTSSNSFKAIEVVRPAFPSCPAHAGHPVRRDVRVSHHRLRLLDHSLSRMMTTVLLHHRRGLPEQQLALFLGADRGL